MSDTGEVAILVLAPEATLGGQSLAQGPDLEVLDTRCGEANLISEADTYDL